MQKLIWRTWSGNARHRSPGWRPSAPNSQLSLPGSHPSCLAGDTCIPAPATPADKGHLFRALFRGRNEIFPTRFMSKKTGKAGYAPACANKFVRGVCDLPRVKCSECPNQAFTPVDDRVVLDHLRGRHVMGIYPLLEDEARWFLAIDFDKSSWQEDVGVFAETCRAVDVPVADERSRSGNGAHAWFFFGAPVAASLARKMGCWSPDGDDVPAASAQHGIV